jgi:hypothetical protein
MYYCHCSMCRKATGSAFATNMSIPAAELEIVTGREFLKGFQSSVGEVRYFCSECGSPIYSEAEARVGRVAVRCGTFIDDPDVRPSRHFFAASKAPWFEIRDDLPRIEPGE